MIESLCEVNHIYFLSSIFVCLARAPELFSYIAKNSQEDVFYEDDIWPGENENG